MSDLQDIYAKKLQHYYNLKKNNAQSGGAFIGDDMNNYEATNKNNDIDEKIRKYEIKLKKSIINELNNNFVDVQSGGGLSFAISLFSELAKNTKN
jgi:hypothetical protein